VRYYTVRLPNEDEPVITTNVRRLKDLPEGTRVFAVFTEPDGSLMDEQELPVEHGRVVFRRRGSIHRQRPTRGAASGKK